MGDVGRVYLVGAGPGDPELLTIKAERVLGLADAVVHDRLVSPEILDLVPAESERIYVGKTGPDHHMAQEEISQLLVDLAKAGKTVVRLKGGDPFIFGRGSEEALHLVRNGISYEVVPGVTAASGVGASLGLPLTHRGLATGVRLLTAHRRGGKGLELDWSRLADPRTTLVFYMGLGTLPEISQQLIAEGLPADTPAAAIARGTAPDQRQILSTLSDLPEAVAEAGLETPALFVIGQVTDLARSLNWQDLEIEGSDAPEYKAHA